MSRVTTALSSATASPVSASAVSHSVRDPLKGHWTGRSGAAISRRQFQTSALVTSSGPRVSPSVRSGQTASLCRWLLTVRRHRGCAARCSRVIAMAIISAMKLEQSDPADLFSSVRSSSAWMIRVPAPMRRSRNRHAICGRLLVSIHTYIHTYIRRPSPTRRSTPRYRTSH